MGNNKKRILAAVLSAAMILTMQPVVYAEEEAAEETTGAETTAVSEADNEGEEEVSTITNIMSTGDRENTYSAYYEKHKDKNAPKKEISIDFGKKGKYEIYLLDKDHDGELVKTTDNLNFNMKVHSCILIKEI